MMIMPNCNICKYAGRPTYKSPRSECKEFSKYEYENKKTNADRIRSLTDEQLARWLEYEGGGACAEVCGWLDWLKQPAEEAPECIN